MKKVLFVLKYRESSDYVYSGDSTAWGDRPKVVDGARVLHSGLYNSASFVRDMLIDEGINAKLVHVLDNSFIHREMMAFAKEDGVWDTSDFTVVIEAFWVVPEKFAELEQACPWAKFVIRNHSETPFLASEGIGFDWTLRYLDYPHTSISCNAPRMLRDTRTLVESLKRDWSPHEIERRTPYLPNFYPLHDATWSKLHLDKPYLDIGCFGAVRPLKNHVIQAIAAIKLAEHHGRGLRFHINAGRVEMNGSPILNNLRGIFSKYENFHLVEHAWRPHDEFKKLVREMDLVTQISFSETFNIVAADAASQGVALVGSREIPWLANIFCADPNDVQSCYDAMVRAFALKHRAPSVNLNLAGLHHYNKESKKEWLKYLGH